MELSKERAVQAGHKWELPDVIYHRVGPEFRVTPDVPDVRSDITLLNLYY